LHQGRTPGTITEYVGCVRVGNVALVVPFCAVMGRIAGFGAGVGPFDLGFMDERPVYVLCGWAARASIRGELAGGMSRLPVFVATSYRLNLIRTTSFPQKMQCRDCVYGSLFFSCCSSERSAVMGPSFRVVW